MAGCSGCGQVRLGCTAALGVQVAADCHRGFAASCSAAAATYLAMWRFCQAQPLKLMRAHCCVMCAAACRVLQAGKVAELQSTLEAQVAATRQAEANAKAAEAKAASQATLAAAARVEVGAWASAVVSQHPCMVLLLQPLAQET